MTAKDAIGVDEAASILGLSRNTVYKMAREGSIPSYRIGRKLRFSRTLLEGKLQQLPLEAPQEAPGARTLEDTAESLAATALTGPVLASDEQAAGIVAHALTSAGIPCRTAPMNSYTALVNLYAGTCQMALCSLYDFRSNSYNTPFVQRLCPGTAVQVIRLLERKRGFIVQAGNPKRITTWSGLVKEGVRVAQQPRGCASRVLADQKLVDMEEDLAEAARHATQPVQAQAAALLVAQGAADVCVGTVEDSLAARGLQFIPQQTEFLDLVVEKSDGNRPLRRALRQILTDDQFKAQLEALVHCDASRCGTVVYEC